MSVLGATGTTVLLIVVALVALGVGMIAVTVWLVRATRTDHLALGPLEVMGDRSFRKAGEEGRQTRLTSARPPGALPPAPIVPLDDAANPDGSHEAFVEPPPPEPSAAEPGVEGEAVEVAEQVDEGEAEGDEPSPFAPPPVVAAEGAEPVGVVEVVEVVEPPVAEPEPDPVATAPPAEPGHQQA